MKRRREEIPGERTGLVQKVTNVALSEIAGHAGAPFAAFTSGLPTTRELMAISAFLRTYGWHANFTGTFTIYRAYLSGMEEDYEMHSMKRQVLSSASAMVVAAAGLVLGVATFTYGGNGTSANAVRHVRGRTIFSEESPKAELSVRRGLRFVGTQQVNLHGNAEAEQYVFARSGRDNIVEQFYLIQFEHFLPTNHLTYDYASMRTTQIGNFQFNYDVKSMPNLGVLLMEDQGSDGEALEQLLTKQHLVLPHNTVMVRMFHLPSADHRTELMIIYGEALPQDTAFPVRNGGVQLDTESPSSAQMFLEHARQGLVVQTR